MSENALPQVSRSFYTDCKKCETERYHTVLTHTSATSAKMKCEVCGSTRTYKLPKVGGGATVKKVSAPRGSARIAAKANEHKAEYDKRMDGGNSPEVYSMKRQFKVSEKVNHPKFGLGVVTKVESDKMEVIFAEEMKILVHNRL